MSHSAAIFMVTLLVCLSTIQVSHAQGCPLSCGANGECRTQSGIPKCQCDIDYTGTVCETQIDNCIGVTCYNGGTCIDGRDAFTCSCAGGWIGDNCETNKDDCNPTNQCVEGVCVDGINGYSCNCSFGFEGDYCNINTYDCVGHQCDHGSCVDGIGSYSCDCDAGWSGEICNVSEYFSCASNNPCNPLLTRYRYHYQHTNPRKFVQCDDHGSCFEMDCGLGTIWGDSARTCVHDPAYVRNPNPCAGVNCNHGWCSNGNCVCYYGYTGVNCNQADVTPWNTGVYSCPNNSPCSPLRQAGQYYYTHVDSNKFVQCSDHGQCWNMPCGAGTQWSITKYTCAIPGN